MIIKLTILITLLTNLLAYKPYKIVGVYFDELAFTISVDGLDIKTKVKNCIPKKNKLATIQWLMKENLRKRKLRVEKLEIKNNVIVGIFYLNNENLSKIFKKKGLCK